MAVKRTVRITLTVASTRIPGATTTACAFNPDGTLDTTLNHNGEVAVADDCGGHAGYCNSQLGTTSRAAVTVQDDGKIIVAGCITRDGTNLGGIYRLNANGSRDATSHQR